MIESTFAKYKLLPRSVWQAELSSRGDLSLMEKEEIARLLDSHQLMPEGFMDVEKVRERQDQVTTSSAGGNQGAWNDFEAGSIIGPYRLETKLGEGGFGVVWRARQTEPVVREVALKILKLGMDSVAILKRFKVEQQMLALMEHPNIAKLIEVGMTRDGRPFFAMELVRGVPVTKYCDDKKLGIRERLGIFVDACLAVNHAHQKGVIHRDLKPSNILVMDDPSGPIAKVIDFGISQATRGSDMLFTQAITARGELLGTPAYMAPEQFSQNTSIDTRADIYALGAVLYELMVGRPPDGPSGAMTSDGLQGALNGADSGITRPSAVLRRLDAGDRAILARQRDVSGMELQSLVSHDLEWIAMKALERDPEVRYATVIGLVNDIRRSEANEPISARSPSRRYIFQKYLRRNRGTVMACCFITLALLVAALFSAREARISQHAAALADRARSVEKESRLRSEVTARRAERAEREAVQQRETARRHAYAADMLLAFQSHRKNDLRGTSRLLRQYQPVGSSRDLRGWEWRYLWGQTRAKTALQVVDYSERVLSALFYSSGDSLVTFEDHGRIALRSLGGERSDILLSASSDGSRLESSGGFLTANPEGTMIAGLHYNEATAEYLIKIWGAESNPMYSLDVGRRRPTGLALSPGGHLVAFFVPAEGEATVMEVASGAVVHREKLQMGNYSQLDQEGACCFSADGKLLALGGGHGRILILRVSDWAPLPKEPRVTGRVTTLAFSPDGRQLAAGSLFQDPRVSIFDVTGDEDDIRLEGHSGFIAKVSFSPDGTLLASGSADQNIKLWRTKDWAEVANLSGHRDEVWAVGFSPDSRTLVSGGKDRSVRLWQVKDWLNGDATALVLANPCPNLALTPDGGGALTVREGKVTFHGSAEGVPGLEASGISQAFWISADSLLCGETTPPEITIRSPSGHVEHRHRLPEDVLEPRYQYLGESGIAVVTMRLPGSGLVRVDRYDVPSLELISSTDLEIPESVRENLDNSQAGYSSFSHDGGRVALKYNWDVIRVYDLVMGELVDTVDTGDQAGIQGLCLSPDGKTLAYAVRERPIIEIHDIETGFSRARLEGHNLVIRKLDFSPDGERLVSTAIGSEPILLWDTVEWEQVASFGPTTGCVSPLAWFLPSGEEMVIRESFLESNHCQLRILKAPSIELINQQEARNR